MAFSTPNNGDPPPCSCDNHHGKINNNYQITEQDKKKKEEMLSLLWKEAKLDPTSDSCVKRRSNYIVWDDYFMAVAKLSSYRSKDPTNPTGACIVDQSNRIVGIGYNGFPNHCSDDYLPWTTGGSDKEGDKKNWLHTCAPYVVQAEVNAILNKCSADVVGARMYVVDFPCNECAKVIIQAGIKKILYLKYPNTTNQNDEEKYTASRILFQMAGVEVQQYKPSISSIDLDFIPALSPTTTTTTTTATVTENGDNKENRNDEKVIDISDNNANCSSSEQNSKELKDGIDYTNVDKNSEISTELPSQVHQLLLSEANYDILKERPQDQKRSHGIILSWDDYFMSMAFLAAQRSKDPNTQVGACIVDSSKRIVGIGYNGFPNGCDDTTLPWSRKGESNLHTKYMYVVHAEVNAILNKGSTNVYGCTIYIALFPCNECAKMIIQSGIKKVIYMNNPYFDTEACRATRILFQLAGVQCEQYIPKIQSLKIEF